MKYKMFFLQVLLSITVLTGIAQQKPILRAANIFTSNMVLQQKVVTPIWGMGAPNEKVSITLGTSKAATVADAQGKWLLKLPSLPAGGPYTLTITGEASTIVLSNVMMGEVWLASGQSNMQFGLNNTDNAKQDIEAANYPDIRLFTVNNETSVIPNADIPKNEWRVCTPATAAFFSAVAYHFARKLQETKKVPIGIINASWGGSSAEAWTSRNMLMELPDYKDKVINLDTDTLKWNSKVAQSRADEKARAEIAKTAKEGILKGVHLGGYDDANWKQSTYPIDMSKIGKFGYWGFVWFRKTIDLPAEAANKELELFLPVYSDEHSIYFNGTEIAHIEKSLSTTYKIPKDLIKIGRNTIAIRIRTYYGTGRIGDKSIVDAPVIRSLDKGFSIHAGEAWKYDTNIEPKMSGWQDYFNTPSVIYNAMIAPLMPLAIKGVIWYQGENNVSKAMQYRTLFPALINDWRNNWKQGDFPFLFVQLAAQQKEGIKDMQQALLQEAQTMTLALPNTGMACAIDLGLRFDIHPKNKKDVGERLCLVARKVAYGENIVSSGPIYESYQVKGSEVHITFNSIGSGLFTKDGGEIKGFKIAGKDSVFHPATALIKGDKVILSSSNVPHPIAVRYSFESWPNGNLYNKESLPAVPFRTDDWNVLK